MRNLLFFFAVILLITAGCAKNDAIQTEEPDDKWNGYFDYYKMGEVNHTIWLEGSWWQGPTDIGTAIYGINDNAEFYVTINIDPASGYKMYKSNMYAGDKLYMPRNRAWFRFLWQRYLRFPYTASHPAGTLTHTFTVPLSTLPPAEEPGFTVATHMLVKESSRCNSYENAWAEGDYKFGCKGFGWYDVFYFNQPEYPYTTLYGTEYSEDSLRVYIIDITNGTTEEILVEYVGEQDGTYDGTAYDDENDEFYFTNYDDQELYRNNMNDTLPSESLGSLDGVAGSADFYDGSFYYVDELTNNIIRVDFDSEGYIASETVLSTIPGTVAVNDIAISPAGDYLYILGNVDNGETELITWDVLDDSYATIDLAVNQGTQIAYGADGVLYALEPNGGTGTSTYILDTSTGVSNPINEDDIIIIDPFADISKGPLM